MLSLEHLVGRAVACEDVLQDGIGFLLHYPVCTLKEGREGGTVGEGRDGGMEGERKGERQEEREK